jgi:hypothetical protein
MASKPKSKPPPVKPDDAEQSRRFEETARELETDESRKAFERVLDAVVPVVKKKQPSP